MASRYALQRVQALLKPNSSIVNSFTLQYRYSSYQNSKRVGNREEYTSKFEVTRSPEDWKYVERLLAPRVVPNPGQKESYPSNWKPPSDAARNEPYFVPRNRNHMIPVYLNSSHRGMRKITEITKIQGDIFQLENELKHHLKTTVGRPVATQVNELVGYIHVKGDHVNVIKEFLMQKGF